MSKKDIASARKISLDEIAGAKILKNIISETNAKRDISYKNLCLKLEKWKYEI